MAVAGSYLILGGLVAQAIKNYREKRSNLTPLLSLAVTYTYICWAAYGWTKPDYFLAATQTPGALIAIGVLVQSIRYRRAERRRS